MFSVAPFQSANDRMNEALGRALIMNNNAAQKIVNALAEERLMHERAVKKYSPL